MLISKRSEIEIFFIIDGRNINNMESNIRNLFNKYEITPTSDYLAGNGNIIDAIRVLAYPISGDCRQITDLCKLILSEIFSVSQQEGLKFYYQM